ncbi:EVE domain-containing protein [Microlunatus sagamiharensis]|uniref:EVE domain-containing protein n=1 Tax=Microlunatus sagamiharensis TaxID=546874 RepID=A0A1H2MJZ9_9ACTN|nr:EVE domain-containing protein [Microlunatus sagamiharensis]SDU93345.1 EVE domain-containing protein [Microlunatus sagamiharensis]
MGQAVSRAVLGAWLLKGNPAVWDVRRFLAEGHSMITSWSVRPGYRSALIRRGDRVVFWLSGPGTGGLPRGVWGLGHVVGPAEPWTDGDRGWWLDDAARHALRARVEVHVPLLDDPLPVAELRAAGVTDLEVQRVPQGSNPSWVSRDQLAALEPLLPPWPSPPR